MGKKKGRKDRGARGEKKADGMVRCPACCWGLLLARDLAFQICEELFGTDHLVARRTMQVDRVEAVILGLARGEGSSGVSASRSWARSRSRACGSNAWMRSPRPTVDARDSPS